MSEQMTPSGKVRVYQTQSRLIGLHASCALALAKTLKSVTPYFNHKPPKGSVAHANVQFCELCLFRDMTPRQLAIHRDQLTRALQTLQLAEDRTRTKGQLEVIEFVRVEKLEAAHEEIVRDEETNRRFGSVAAKITGPPTHEFPPTRRMTDTEATARRASDRRAIMGDKLVSPVAVVTRPGKSDPAEVEAAFFYVEAEAVARRGRRAKLVALPTNGKRVTQQSRPGESLLDADLMVALAVEGMNETRGASGIGPLEAEAVPARVAVSWLKDKVRQYRGKLATEGLAPVEQAHLDAYRKALTDRGWTEE